MIDNINICPHCSYKNYDSGNYIEPGDKEVLMTCGKCLSIFEADLSTNTKRFLRKASNTYILSLFLIILIFTISVISLLYNSL